MTIEEIIEKEVKKFEEDALEQVESNAVKLGCRVLMAQALTRISQATREDLLAKLPKELRFGDREGETPVPRYLEGKEPSWLRHEQGHNECLSEIRKIIKGI